MQWRVWRGVKLHQQRGGDGSQRVERAYVASLERAERRQMQRDAATQPRREQRIVARRAGAVPAPLVPSRERRLVRR